jgi:hypothetical protein
VDESGAVLPTFNHRGGVHVLGALGQRYLVRVRNGSARRAEVVVSVDGRDVLDGGPSATRKRGYLVEPYGTVEIDGFRLSDAAVAAFRFSSVSRSYAGKMGDARDVGVIGVAVFPERAPRYVPQPVPPPYSYPERAPRLDDEPSASAPERAERHADAGQAAPSSSADAGAPSAAPRSESRRKLTERPGLGTEFGEQHASSVQRVEFERASSSPEVVLTLRYDDRRGLVALGIDVDRLASRDEAWLRQTADPFRRDVGYARPPPGWNGR